MEANKEYEIGYYPARCCANCNFLAPTVWGEGAVTSWCLKHDEQVWITAICDSFLSQKWILTNNKPWGIPKVKKRNLSPHKLTGGRKRS